MKRLICLLTAFAAVFACMGMAMTARAEDETYETTFTIECTINTITTGTDAGKMCINDYLVFDDNVVSVDFLKYEDWYPQNLRIAKINNYYTIQGTFEQWTDPMRVVYIKIKVISTGEITFYSNKSYKPKITSVNTTLQQTPEIPSEPVDKDELLESLIKKMDGLIAERQSEGLDKVWEILRPFAVYILSALLSGALIAGLIRRAITKKYDTHAIAEEVSRNIVNKDVRVDLSSLARNELTAIGTALKTNMHEGLAPINDMRRSVALLCNALSKSKTLTAEEREELAAEAAKLDADIVTATRENIVVRLEKTDDGVQKTESGGLFDYLNK